MNSIAITEILNNIPDFSSWEEALFWMQEGRNEIVKISHEWAMEAEFFSLEWNQIKEASKFPFGYHSSTHWRKFVLATFFADICSYPKTTDQVSFDRLLYVMHAFPEGFRVWFVKMRAGVCWPIGYSAWYPMFETLYDIMKNNPEKLKNRICIPNPSNLGKNKNLYLFNFSVIAPFKKTECSRALMKNYVLDICNQNPDGMACITVAPDGDRIAKRLGLTLRGYFEFEGDKENVYAK